MSTEQRADRFQEKTTSYLRDLAARSPAIRTMYFFDPEHEDVPASLDNDLFFEKRLATTKGLVAKYPGRALLLLSYTCAANCRFCERQDRVGVGLDAEGRLRPEEIRAAVDHLRDRPDIYEVIFSGGDPLMNSKGLRLAAELLGQVEHVTMLRIHTRVPVQLPSLVDFDMLAAIVDIPSCFYLSVHIDHPDELTPESEAVITRLRKLGFVMLCQSVFLRGVNDDVDTLRRLYERLAALGVRPYYIYHCQPIPTTMRFVMDIGDEVAIMSQLRQQLSGLAYPQHVLELQHTTGKVIVPTDHWDVDLGTVRDFVGATHDVRQRALTVQPPADDALFEQGVLEPVVARRIPRPEGP
jgi:lysine 2,3-aminomutase